MDIYAAVIPLRITLGIIMLDSGIGKWKRGITGTGQWFASLGFPKPQILARFVTPQEFENFRKFGYEIGFRHVESGPLARSSYHAADQAHLVKKNKLN